MAKRRLGAIKRDPFKVTEADRRSRNAGSRSPTYGRRTMQVSIDVERDSRWSGRSAADNEKKQYVANACVRGAGVKYHAKTGTYSGGHRCGTGWGHTPSVAVRESLKKLSAKITKTDTDRRRAKKRR